MLPYEAVMIEYYQIVDHMPPLSSSVVWALNVYNAPINAPFPGGLLNGAQGPIDVPYLS